MLDKHLSLPCVGLLIEPLLVEEFLEPPLLQVELLFFQLAQLLVLSLFFRNCLFVLVDPVLYLSLLLSVLSEVWRNVLVLLNEEAGRSELGLSVNIFFQLLLGDVVRLGGVRPRHKNVLELLQIWVHGLLHGAGAGFVIPYNFAFASLYLAVELSEEVDVLHQTVHQLMESGDLCFVAALSQREVFNIDLRPS